MLNDTIKISCPICGAVLIVRNVPGIETKFVTCPNCKKQSHFTKFKRVGADENAEHTQYSSEAPSNQATGGQYGNANIPAQPTGKIYVPSTGRSYPLKPGKNIIGRRSPNSSADIQLDCSNYISRNHLIVEVMGNPANGFSYCISLFKKNVNKTYISNNELVFGDSIVLNNGDTIKLPELDLIFKD